MKKFFSAVVCIFGIAWLSSVSAKDLFTIVVDVNGVTQEAGFNNIEDFVDAFGDDGLSAINDFYTDTAAAEAIGDIRGVNALVRYDEGSPWLHFEVTGIKQCSYTFRGNTREESRDQLEDWLTENGDRCLTDISQSWVANTGIDPVGGNPNSLMALMAAADFGVGSSLGSDPGFRATGGGDKQDGAPRLLSVGARYGHYEVDGYNQDVVQIPLGYKVPLADPRWAVIIDAPWTFVDTEGGYSYNGSAGVGLRIPVLDNWSLTPIARIGGVGSTEMGSFSGVYSASIVSDLIFALNNLELVIGNSITYSSTLKVGWGDAEHDYDLTNTVFRNGIGLQGSIRDKTLFGKPMTWEISAINTQFTGDDTYISNYTELHATIGSRTEDRTVVWDSLRLGMSYTFGDQGYDGFRVSFGYQW